mgnify:FL=1
MLSSLTEPTISPIWSSVYSYRVREINIWVQKRPRGQFIGNSRVEEVNTVGTDMSPV